MKMDIRRDIVWINANGHQQFSAGLAYILTPDGYVRIDASPNETIAEFDRRIETLRKEHRLD